MAGKERQKRNGMKKGEGTGKWCIGFKRSICNLTAESINSVFSSLSASPLPSVYPFLLSSVTPIPLLLPLSIRLPPIPSVPSLAVSLLLEISRVGSNFVCVGGREEYRYDLAHNGAVHMYEFTRNSRYFG